jgi:histone-lysine N-methyltransferase SETMAR
MSVEQRYVIKYLHDEGLNGVEIIQRIKNHYGPDALPDSTIYYWIAQAKLKRTDLINIPSPGKPPIEGLDAQILQLLEEDPYISARQMAQSLHVSFTTVCNRLSNSLGMRCCNLRFVPHMLTPDQKAKRTEMAEAMLRELTAHEASHFSFIYTGDESWMLYDYPHTTHWIPSWGEREEVERPSHHHRKVMLTVFFNGTGRFTMNWMEEGRTMNSEYFCQEVLPSVAAEAYGEGRAQRARKVWLHFDNAPIHNTKQVISKLNSLQLKRMNHPPYSPDLAPCDFFLFGYIKRKLAGSSFVSSDDLFSAIDDIMNGISGEMILSVFQKWMARLRACCDCGGNYVE